jgi:iron complex outermembrane receptor protein
MATKRNGWRALAGVAAAALAATAPAAALGQTAAPPAAAEGASDSDIIVTARRIEERLQDVPISVSALSAEDLRRQQIDDLGDIAEKTVGFAFESFTGALAQPTIRGQTNLRTTSPVQNVGTYLNGVYLQRNYFVDQSLLDFTRVEIIKGPQSALYGRNAFAGVINLVAREADVDDFYASAIGTVGNHKRYDLRGGVNVPIIPGKLAVFASVGHSEYDGSWGNNHPLADAGGDTDGNVGGYDKQAYQVGIAAQIAESLLIKGLYIRTERDQEQVPAITLSTAGLTYNFNSLNASPRALPGSPLQNRLWVGELLTTTVNAPGETRLPGLVIDPRTWGLRGPTEIIIGKARFAPGGPFAFEYTFGRTEAEITVRGSSPRDPLVPTVLFGTNFGTVFDSSGTDSSFQSNSHDFKISYDFGRRVSGFIGVNYQSTSDIDSNAAEFAPVNSLQEPDPRSRFEVGPGLPIPTTVLFRRNTFLLREEQVWSMYGYVNLKPTDRLAITLEGRYTIEDQKAADLIASDPAPNTGRMALETPRTARSAEFFTPRVSATYRLGDDNIAYASVARGVKSGGINGVSAQFRRVVNPITGAVTFVQLTPGSPIFIGQQTYEAETNWTYEIGTKNSFFDRRLVLNVAAFYTDWRNIQSNAVRLQPDGTPPTSFAAIVPSLIGNVGDVRVWGFEVEGSLRVLEAVRVDFGAAYNKARYRDGTVSQRFGASGNCDGTVCAYVSDPAFTFPVLPIGGNQLERTPQFDALLGVTYETEFANGWGFFLRGDSTYQTKQFADEANLAFVPDRLLVNASTGLNVGAFSIQAWVKNLANKEYVTSALFLIGTGGGGSANYVPILGERRTFGLTVSARFQ